MSKTKNKFLTLICVLLIAALGTAAGAVAFAAEADADVNGWVVGSNVHTNRGLTETDAYSSFQLDNGGVTINDFELDITKEITFAFRDRGTGTSRAATYITVADSGALNGWRNMTSVPSSPLEFKLTDSEVSVNRGFTDAKTDKWSTSMGATHYITVYIGTGGEDKSYAVFDGVRKQLGDSVVRSAYASGKAKLFIGSPNARGLEMASPFAPVVTSAAVKLDLTAGDAPDITINYINAVSGEFTLKASQYNEEDYVFGTGDFTVTPNSGDSSRGSIVLSGAAVAKVNWRSADAYITVANSGGVYKYSLQVKSGEAPRFTDETSGFNLTYGNIQKDVNVQFTYADKDTPIVTRGLAPLSMTSRDREELNGGDFTLNSNGGVYSLALKKEYLSRDEQGTRWYRIETKNGALEFPVFISGESGWATRSGKGSITPAADGNYLDLSLNGYDYAVDGTSIGGAYSRAGRAFYTQPIDVTKPIFIEYGNYTAGGWILFDFNDNPYGIEYCNENKNATPSIIKILDMVANASEQQRWGGSAGFITNQVVGMGQFLNSNNNNVLEIGIGVTADESYIKVNGNDLTKGFRDTGEVTVKQSDFAGGKAYLSVFCGTVTSFTVNKNVNSVAVYYPNGEPTYELKSNVDLEFTVKNADSDLTVSYRGKQLQEGVDYEFSGETLTVMGSYMRTIAFASTITLQLSSHGTATLVNIPAYPGTAVSAAKIADGENAVKYYEGADLTYKFDLGGEQFINVVDAASENELPEGDYSFGDSVLTLKTSAVSSRAKGAYTFLLQTEASLVPFYVVNYGFNNGYAALGELTVTPSGSAYAVAGAGELVIEKTFDLTAGFKADLTFTEVTGYYETAAPSGNANSFVALKFYDVVSGNSAIFRIRPNASDDSAFIKNKLWGEIELVNSDGNAVNSYGAALRLGAMDKHALSVKFEGGKFIFAIADEPSLELDAGDFNIDCRNLILQAVTVETPDSDKSMKYVLEFENASPVNPENPSKGGAGCGCGGSSGASAVGAVIALFIAAGAAVCVKKRAVKK